MSIAPDGRISVADDGARLSPRVVGHPTTGIEMVAAVSVLGAIPDAPGYPVSGALHGVGLAVVNALSERFEVELDGGPETLTQRFARGLPITPVLRGLVSRSPWARVRIDHLPDPEIFRPPVRLPVDAVRARLRELSWLRPDLRLSLTSHDRREELHAPHGLRAWFPAACPAPLLVEPFAAHGRIQVPECGGEVRVDVALSYTAERERLVSWANLVAMPEGGTHLGGLREGVQGGGRAWLAKRGAGRGRADFTRGLTGAIAVLVPQPVHGGPRRSSLANPELEPAVRRVVEPAFEAWLEGLSREDAGVILRRVKGGRRSA